MADTKVQEVMTHLVVMLSPTDTTHEAAQRLTRNSISGAPVVQDGKVVGIVSESDLIHAVIPSTHATRGASILDVLTTLGRAQPRNSEYVKTVSDLMTPIVVTVSPSTSVWTAASLMDRRGVKRLPVVDDQDYLLGIISRADVVKAMARTDVDLSEEVLDSIRILGEETIDGLVVSVKDGVATVAGQADRRSTHELALKLAARVPGIVSVIDGLDYSLDDKHLKKPPLEDNPKDPSLDWHPEALVHKVR